MKEWFSAICILCAFCILAFISIPGLNYSKQNDTYEVPGFPEKMTEQTGPSDIPWVVVEQCFVNPVKKLYAQSGGRLKVGHRFLQGIETKRPVVAFFFVAKGDKALVCAYYYDELIQSVREKYPDGYSTQQAIEVLYPIIENAVKKLLVEFYY